MERRQFTVEAARLLLGGAVIAISGCGTEKSPSGPTASMPPVTDVTGTVLTNHGHAVTITAAQLLQGNGLELDIRGSSGHGHMVTLTAEEVANIRVGMKVEKNSTGTGHTHMVTFNA